MTNNENTTKTTLRYERHFATAGLNPYDSVQWTKRDVSITDDTGKAIFIQKDVEAPQDWSDMAVKVVASKYFYGQKGTQQREKSIQQLVSRVCSTIANCALADGYLDKEGRDAFHDDLVWCCLRQMFAFNSPVWFNVGLHEAYGITQNDDNDDPTKNHWGVDKTTGKASLVDPRILGQASACFILQVDDNMDSIMQLATDEAMLFKFGSGTGTNLSSIRSSRETIKGGGQPSGPLSFLKIYDQVANVVKSGGKCLAPDQLVYTHRGPVQVQELAHEQRDFVTLSYDPPAGRIKAKWARAFEAGTKVVLAIKTDKGEFHLSEDHPVKLADGRFVQARHLKKGQALFAAAIKRNAEHRDYFYGMVRQAPWIDEREAVHRIVAQDVCGHHIDGSVVHHKDGNTKNNHPDNLELLSGQSEHASLHNRGLVEKGEHTFQLNHYNHSGEANGMHATSSFFTQPEKEAEWKIKLGTQSKRYAAKAQKFAVRKRMLNNAWKLINLGHDISTVEAYNKAMNSEFRGTLSLETRTERVQRVFGSHENFVDELRTLNHRVISIEAIGSMSVYDVEVDCPTADDKTPSSGHNFAICPYGSKGFGQMLFVSNTRRAAKINVLNDTHPDIEEFILAKMLEEKKAKALIQQGYASNFNGEAYTSVAFQNENLSVRASDKFMQAAIDGQEWTTKAVTTGNVVEAKNAGKLLEQIAEGTWLCGDPGMQFDDTIHKYHTCKGTDRQMCTNPCSEYLFLNNTACNLASINLMKFVDDSNAFNATLFRHCVDMVFLAQEVLVDNTNYPTKAVAENSHIFRTIGIGYSNLGGMLMSLGMPYDSDEARELAGKITAIMTGEAYLQSAKIAMVKGPFKGYRDARCCQVENTILKSNESSMMDVMYLHRSNMAMFKTKDELYDKAVHCWDEAIELGNIHGYRNAQASVCAPTGTISFMMDCATTGIEPELALIKYKSLAGGGSLTLVNPLVSRSLTTLGYAQADIDAITKHISKYGTIEDQPDQASGLHARHLPVFDCSFKPAKGKRFIHHMAHLKIMAACQPFISGGISKTVNVPNSATIGDIRDTYVEAWKLGLKCVAIYRDGSKSSQPLNTSKTKDSVQTQDQLFAIIKDREQALKEKDEELTALWERLNMSGAPVRKRLQDTRRATTHKFDIAGHEGYLTVGMFEDGTPGELFITIAKEGSTVAGLCDCVATLTSISLQYGVPLEALVKKFSYQRFDPSGFTKNKDIRQATSIIDYIFRWMALSFLGSSVPEPVVVLDNSSLLVNLSNGHGHGLQDTAKTMPVVEPSSMDNPSCSECGHVTIRSGTCFKCVNCGTSMGCS